MKGFPENNEFILYCLSIILTLLFGLSECKAINLNIGTFNSTEHWNELMLTDLVHGHKCDEKKSNHSQVHIENTTMMTPPPTSVTLNPIKDTWLNEDAGNEDLNYGLSTELRVDRQDTKLERTLLQFDLPTFPACAVITSATLKLTKVAGNNDINIDVHRVTSEWDEGTGGLSGNSGDASWNERQPGVPWTTIGGDYDVSVSSVNVLGNGDYFWDVTSIVQDWVSGTNNFGLLLQSPDGGGDRPNSFASNENVVSADRPELTITYESFGNPMLWLMADAGFSATTWTDQGTQGNDGIVYGNPTQIPNSMNFNPAINFDGDDHVEVNLPDLVFDGGTRSVAVFAVYKPSTTATSIGVFGNQSGSGLFSLQISDGNFGQGDAVSPLPSLYGTDHHLVTYIIDEENNIGGGANDSKIYLNGTLLTSFTYNENDVSDVDNDFHIGKSGSNVASQFFQGDIHEILVYFQDDGNVAITEAQRIQIESYLAIKYGITLSHDYTDSQ